MYGVGEDPFQMERHRRNGAIALNLIHSSLALARTIYYSKKKRASLSHFTSNLWRLFRLGGD